MSKYLVVSYPNCSFKDQSNVHTVAITNVSYSGPTKVSISGSVVYFGNITVTGTCTPPGFSSGTFTATITGTSNYSSSGSKALLNDDGATISWTVYPTNTSGAQYTTTFKLIVSSAGQTLVTEG